MNPCTYQNFFITAINICESYGAMKLEVPADLLNCGLLFHPFKIQPIKHMHDLDLTSQGHFRSRLVVPNESPYMTSYPSIIFSKYIKIVIVSSSMPLLLKEIGKQKAVFEIPAFLSVATDSGQNFSG